MQTKLIKEIDKANMLLVKFHCGNEEIDSYFQNKALNDDDAVTYCFLDDNLSTIIALSSLSCNGIIVKSKKSLYTYPAVEIKMFAVNDCFKHKSCPIYEGLNWSDYCFDTTISIITQFTEKYCGASRVFLYSVPQAVHFYKRQHMQEFTDLMCRDDRAYLKGCTPMLMCL